MTSSRWERAQSIAEALRRAGAGAPPRRRATQVRTYDEAGRVRAIDPAEGPGAHLAEAAEAMIRLAAD